MFLKDPKILNTIHCKKSFSIFPSLAGISLTKLSMGGNNLYMTSLFPPRESLVSDIPAGDGNIGKLFYGVLFGWALMVFTNFVCLFVKKIPN
jgi:hypothetical protein